MKRMTISAVVAAVTLSAGCSVTPTVMKEQAMLTPKQIADMGLQCRQITPVDSNIPKTICASETSWEAYERRARLATEDLLAEGRKLPNAGRFNRN